VPEPVPVARLVLARDEAEVPADRLGGAEPVRVVDERGHRLGRPGPDPRDGPQHGHGRRLPGLAVQLLFDAPDLPRERLDLFEQ
jgi:hypothetical protein